MYHVDAGHLSQLAVTWPWFQLCVGRTHLCHGSQPLGLALEFVLEASNSKQGEIAGRCHICCPMGLS